jgi:hypothetical protein
VRFERLLKSIDENLTNNPYITGVYIIYHWRLLEPHKGQLDFTRLDRVIQLVRKHARYYKLAINPGIYTPDWVYAIGAEAFNTVGSNPARKKIYQQDLRIPVPWDVRYQSSYFDTLSKVAQRYADDRAFRAITLTVATFMSPEWHLPKSPTDRRQWRNLEGFPERLEQAWKQGVDRFAAHFPAQYLVLEASSSPLGLQALGDALIEYGATRYAGRFAVQVNQLHGRFDQLHQAGYAKLLDYQQKYGADIVIGLQNLKGWGHSKSRERQGSEQMSVYNFVQAQADYWELWYRDGSDVETCERLQRLSQEALDLGLQTFQQQLIEQGEYRSAGKD